MDDSLKLILWAAGGLHLLMVLTVIMIYLEVVYIRRLLSKRLKNDAGTENSPQSGSRIAKESKGRWWKVF